MSLLIVLIILAIALGFYVIGVYNSLQTMKTRIRASIQEIGNQLKRQADLIPNLEESVKGYLKHEKGILKMLADARKQVVAASESGDLNQMSTAENTVSQLLPQLRIAVEDNPELQASTNINKLMEELRDTADKVMFARRTLIDLTADYNVRLVTFPSNMIANSFGFKPEKGLDVEGVEEMTSVTEAETKAPKVKLSQ